MIFLHVQEKYSLFMNISIIFTSKYHKWHLFDDIFVIFDPK